MAKPIEPTSPATPTAQAQPMQPISRFEAQRSLGLFAKWDYTMFGLILFTWVSVLYYWLLRPEPSFSIILFGLLITLLLAVAWLIVLVYRVLVFILDVHADIMLLPEAASRIVLGYYEGRTKK